MFTIQDFDPTATSNGTIKTQLGGCGKLYLFNESNTSLTLQYHDAQGDVLGILPAWYARAFTLTRPGSIIFWSQRNTLSFVGTQPWISHVAGASGVPQFLVQGESYYDGEDTSNLYVGPLVRQSNIGNVVSTSQGSVAQVINDGNATPTTVVESTPQGASASTLFEQNDGTITFRDTAGNINFQIIPGGAARDVRIPGGFLGIEALGNAINTSGTDRDWISNGGDTVFQSPKGTETGRITNAGVFKHTLFGSAFASMNGATGSFKLIQPFAGNDFKVIVGFLSGYKGLAGSAQSVSLPVPFTGKSIVFVTGLPSVGIQFLSAGVAQTMDIISALGTNAAAGTSGSGTTLRADSFAQIRTGFDAISVPAADVNTTNAILLIFGDAQ